ncbi:hypothetical protein F0358_15095 [Empedobacter brevis]|uniref:hypothetical protein n=1 Tax=Empedobacter brevis TaxID=247 RepID=UPI00123D2ADB|nr:hypothetical protein [Empedobacter brevis]QES93947.1 hypothetical protein F0358_15095 [Empedobacter brevis]
MLVSGYAFSQVGVNTETPTETLDVKGTVRIQELPKNLEENSIYNGDTTKQTQFNATRTVVADDNGVVGYVDGLPSSNNGQPGNEEETTAKLYNKCIKLTEQELTNLYGNGGLRLEIGDYVFEWYRVGNTPFTVDGNYFRFTNTARNYRYNSWGLDGNTYRDNYEQDNMGTYLGEFERFTQNFNHTIGGKKTINELLIIDNGDVFRFNGYMFRSRTAPNVFEYQFCMSIEQLRSGQN